MLCWRAGMESGWKDEQGSHIQDDEKGREYWSMTRESKTDAQEAAEISLKSDHKFTQEK